MDSHQHMLTSDLGIKGYLHMQRKTFNALGIDILSPKRTFRAPWITAASGMVTLLMILSMAHYSWSHRHEVNLMAAALSPMLQCVLAIWKSSIFAYQHKSMIFLLLKVHALSVRVFNGRTQRAIFVQENMRDYRMNTTYYMAILVTASAALLSPIFVGVVVYLRTGNFHFETPLRGSYYVDISKPFNYICIYFLTIIVVYFVLNASVGVDSLYSWYVHNIVAHFRLLQQQLQNLSEQTTAHELHACINYHQKNLALANLINRILSPIVFAEFALNSAQICFLAYQILAGISITGLPFLVAFLGAVGVQLTIYCYGGQRIEDESRAVAIVLQRNVNWRSWPMPLRKLFRLVIMRAQKYCQLTGIFFIVNYPLFLWVARTAASYITLLSSLN